MVRMNTTPIEPVRGMRDILPDDQDTKTRVQALLHEQIQNYGYRTIDLPILEHRDLYVRKMGEDLVGKVYEFSFGGRDLALRPEWTASVLRAYVAYMQDRPLPQRLCYSGPVFRYQIPQEHTYRQFSQLGVELVGATPPYADTEVLTLACAGLDAAGVDTYRVRLAHIGVVRDVLKQLDLAERTQGLLLWSLEAMRTDGVEAVREHLYELMGELPLDPALLEGLDDDQATTLLLGVFRAMGINLAYGTRPPEAIVGRLVRKLRRGDPQPRIDHALDLLWHLSQVCGPPTDALAQATTLLNEAGISLASLQELESILESLAHTGLSNQRMVLDFGMGRGLHYYTGLIFEMYDDNDVQLCGGGRYDDLVQVLGGTQSVPAVGFAYDVDRVCTSTSLADHLASRRHQVVVLATPDTYAAAHQVAHQLRQQQCIVCVDVVDCSVAEYLDSAYQRHLDAVVLPPSTEHDQTTLLWYDCTSQQEQRIHIDEVGILFGTETR